MDQIQYFFNSLTVEQIALAIGSITFLLHSVLNRNERLSKALNLFIVRATSLVLPILTALATDPNVTALVHNYFPALLGFFTAYQGLYHFSKAVNQKVNSIKDMAKAQAV